MGMTPKQQRFVEEYMVDMNATQAATRAGYSAKTANEQGARLLANVSVADAIAKKCMELAERCNVTVEALSAELEKARVLAMANGNPAAAVSAIMGKAKLYGFLVEKKEVTGKGGGPIEHKTVSQEAVRREIEEQFAEPLFDNEEETSH